MKMLVLNVFPRTLLQETLTLETKIYSTSLKECFVSYSTYKVVNGNPGYILAYILITVMSSVTLITEIIKFGRL